MAKTITIYVCESCDRMVSLSDTASLTGKCDGTHPVFGRTGIHIYAPVRLDAIPDRIPAAWPKAS